MTAASVLTRTIEFTFRKIYFNLETLLMVCARCERWAPPTPPPLQAVERRSKAKRVMNCNSELAVQEMGTPEGPGWWGGGALAA